MPAKGKPYRSPHRLELDRIEARRSAAGVSLEDLCAKAGLPTVTYRRMRRSGLAFKRHVNALAMAMRTLEGEARREGELFPFGTNEKGDDPRPLAGGAGPSTGSGAGGVSAGSGPGQPHGSGRARP